ISWVIGRVRYDLLMRLHSFQIASCRTQGTRDSHRCSVQLNPPATERFETRHEAETIPECFPQFADIHSGISSIYRANPLEQRLLGPNGHWQLEDPQEPIRHTAESNSTLFGRCRRHLP